MLADYKPYFQLCFRAPPPQKHLALKRPRDVERHLTPDNPIPASIAAVRVNGR